MPVEYNPHSEGYSNPIRVIRDCDPQGYTHYQIGLDWERVVFHITSTIDLDSRCFRRFFGIFFIWMWGKNQVLPWNQGVFISHAFCANANQRIFMKRTSVSVFYFKIFSQNFKWNLLKFSTVPIQKQKNTWKQTKSKATDPWMPLCNFHDVKHYLLQLQVAKGTHFQLEFAWLCCF